MQIIFGRTPNANIDDGYDRHAMNARYLFIREDDIQTTQVQPAGTAISEV